MRIRWNKAIMGTGVISLDNQHRMLLDALNDLLCAAHAGRTAAEIGYLLDFLDAYVAIHFAHEELLMTSHRCPAANANEQAHLRFLSNFAAMKSNYAQHGPTPEVIDHIQKELIDWFGAHICGCDAQLREYAPPCGNKTVAAPTVFAD